jgi:hypothetical protein
MEDHVNSRLAAGQHNRGRWGILLGVVAVVVVTTALSACVPVRSSSDLVGTYELNLERERITLVLTPDGSFTEDIRSESGKIEHQAGRWDWGSGRLGFYGLWIPRSFAPEYILRADSEAKGNRQKYTEPGYWAIRPENHWGRMVLSIFPDAGINFERIE